MFQSQVCFCVTALLPLLTSAAAVLVKEQCVLGSTSGVNLALTSSGFQERSQHHMIQLWNAAKQPNVFFPPFLIFLWQATRRSDSAKFYFMHVRSD